MGKLFFADPIMHKNNDSKIIKIIGTLLIITGFAQAIVPNESWYHDPLQFSFVLGVLLILMPNAVNVLQGRPDNRAERLLLTSFLLTIIGGVQTFLTTQGLLPNLLKIIFAIGVVSFLIGLLMYRNIDKTSSNTL